MLFSSKFAAFKEAQKVSLQRAIEREVVEHLCEKGLTTIIQDYIGDRTEEEWMILFLQTFSIRVEDGYFGIECFIHYRKLTDFFYACTHRTWTFEQIRSKEIMGVERSKCGPYTTWMMDGRKCVTLQNTILPEYGTYQFDLTFNMRNMDFFCRWMDAFC